MGRIRKAIIQKEKEEAALKLRKSIPRKEEEWDVNEEGFYQDEVEKANEGFMVSRLNEDHVLLDDIEPASFSEDSDTEVLPLDLPDEYDEESLNEDNSDIFEPSADEETAGPSDKAWGQRKTSFYDTDFIGDEAQLDVSDESLAEEEEREAIALQQRMLDSLEQRDYDIDTLLETMQLNKGNDAGNTRLTVKKELSEMSESEKVALLQHQWPEFMELFEDLTDKLKYIKEKIDPLENILHRNPHCFTEQGATLVRAFKQFHQLYCVNVMLYLNVRASKVRAEDHPVIKRIVELREIISLIRTGMGDVDTLLDRLRRNNVKEFTSNSMIAPSFASDSDIKSNKKRERDPPETDGIAEVEDPLEYYQTVKAQKKKKRVSFIDLPLENDEEEGKIPTEDSKRGITYQIAQNKGLTPKRKKEQRNPRVKHRNKYVKAVKKHRKVVRPVENELARYGGERGGIKARLSRSVKIK